MLGNYLLQHFNLYPVSHPLAFALSSPYSLVVRQPEQIGFVPSICVPLPLPRRTQGTFISLPDVVVTKEQRLSPPQHPAASPFLPLTKTQSLSISHDDTCQQLHPSCFLPLPQHTYTHVLTSIHSICIHNFVINLSINYIGVFVHAAMK